jgi:hypothetical protein
MKGWSYIDKKHHPILITFVRYLVVERVIEDDALARGVVQHKGGRLATSQEAQRKSCAAK